MTNDNIIKCSSTAAHKRDGVFRATKFVGNGHCSKRGANTKYKDKK